MGKESRGLEEFTENELMREIDKAYQQWQHIRLYGCQDPFWPDGVNMNLVRNHIIYYKEILSRRIGGQMTLESGFEIEGIILTPPKVNNDYMALNGQYSDRLKNRVKINDNSL